jgi:hypothetical protein
MVETERGGKIEICLSDGGSAMDQITISLNSGQCAVSLPLHQARALATEIIMAVNRAEVRANLRVNHNMRRRDDADGKQEAAPKHAYAK